MRMVIAATAVLVTISGIAQQLHSGKPASTTAPAPSSSYIVFGVHLHKAGQYYIYALDFEGNDGNNGDNSQKQ